MGFMDLRKNDWDKLSWDLHWHMIIWWENWRLLLGEYKGSNYKLMFLLLLKVQFPIKKRGLQKFGNLKENISFYFMCHVLLDRCTVFHLSLIICLLCIFMHTWYRECMYSSWFVFCGSYDVSGLISGLSFCSQLVQPFVIIPFERGQNNVMEMHGTYLNLCLFQDSWSCACFSPAGAYSSL